MAETEYTTTTPVAMETLWDFVKEMDHWAPFVTGYQHHEKQSETESTWTLKGDVGVLARTLTFRVRITEWNGPERVRFELEGVNEPMTGAGTFTLSRESGGGPAADAGSAPETAAVPAPAPHKGFFARLAERIARLLFRWRHGRVERPGALADATTPAGGDRILTRMTFHLRIDPGGPMAPMINAMVQPMLVPAAEQLAERILAAVEGRPAASENARSVQS